MRTPNRNLRLKALPAFLLLALGGSAGAATLTVNSLADGTVGGQVAEIGGILAPGRPVIARARQDAPWFSFPIREDRLDGLTVGTAVELRLADGRTLPARVTVLRPLGEFATWRAARAVGDHDLNSFRLRVDPLAGIEGLEPGMTVWLAAKP